MTEQDKFSYSLPETDAPSRWDGLSEYARQSMGTEGSGAADLLEGKNGTEDLAALGPAVVKWAQGRVNLAVEKWQRYRSDDFDVPESSYELAEGHPAYAQTIQRLFRAHAMLAQSEEVVSGRDDQNISEVMYPTLVPWQYWRDGLDQFTSSVIQLRAMQSSERYDYIEPKILEAIEDDQPLYRDPDEPAERLSTSEYLDRKIAADGPWGIMLAQMTDHPGVESDSGYAPAKHTRGGKQHLTIQDVEVDAMGVLEWLSLTLQEGPRLSATDYSLLLANHFQVGENTYVPFSGWHLEDKKPGIYIGDPTELAMRKVRRKPRLAVL